MGGPFKRIPAGESPKPAKVSAGVIDTSVADRDGFVHATSAATRIEVDSKAMRKIKEGDVIGAVVEATELLTAEMVLGFESRMLVKLA